MTSMPLAEDSSGSLQGAGQKLERAYLILHEPSADGSLSKPGPEIDRIEFQFNPKELSFTKTAKWARATGKGNKQSGPPQYNGPEPSRLSLEMFFDAGFTRAKSVTKQVDQLFNCCVPTLSSFNQGNGSPPWVLFRWGELTGFLSYISSVAVKYTLFSASGSPVRATCTLTLEQLAGQPPGQNPTSGGLVPRRIHTVVAGDTLAGVAYREYGNAALWRAVARVNEIDDPMRLQPGSRLLLPAREELRAHGLHRPVTAVDPTPDVSRAR